MKNMWHNIKIAFLSLITLTFNSCFSAFDNLPADLKWRVENVPSFTTSDLNEIDQASDQDRVNALINTDPAINGKYKTFISILTNYLFNEAAYNLFLETGTGEYEVWLIEEGLVDNATNTMKLPEHLYSCNEKIFKYFIGLTLNQSLTSGQETLKTTLYSTLEANTDPLTSIAAKKYRRVIHPISGLPSCVCQ